jgi:hypothetical protein
MPLGCFVFIVRPHAAGLVLAASGRLLTINAVALKPGAANDRVIATVGQKLPLSINENIDIDWLN